MARLLGFYLILVACTLVQCQSCPPNLNDDIQRCVVPVAQFAEALGVHTAREPTLAAGRLLPNMGAEVFRDLCARIAVFNACTQIARHQCPNHITLALINASYGFLCSDGFDIFMGHADCLMNLDQDPTIRRCHDETMGRIKNVSRDLKSTMQHKLLTMCNALNDFAVCVEQPIFNECGATAWSVIERVLRDTTRTLVPTCQFTATVVSGTFTITARPVGTSKILLNDDVASSTPTTRTVSNTRTTPRAGANSSIRIFCDSWLSRFMVILITIMM